MNRKVEKISMIGYSLGGLILRYAIGILGKRGIFDQIKPEVSCVVGDNPCCLLE